MTSKSRKYYVLFEREADGKWYAQFGDYVKAVVTQERRDMHESYPFPKMKDLRVVETVDCTTEALRQANEALNAQG